MATRLFTAALIAVVGFAQFSASWHESSVQHVRCAEHGELTHVAALSDQGTPPPRGVARTTFTGSEAGTPEGHDHCAVAFTFRGSAQQQVLRVSTRFAPPPAVVRRAGDPAPRPGRSFVLASAPKTSPPSA
jgi:hypothetical protein